MSAREIGSLLKAISLVVLGASGCQAALGFEDFSGGGSAAVGGTSGTGGGSAGASGGTSGAGGVAGGGGGSACTGGNAPGTHGPQMVAVPNNTGQPGGTTCVWTDANEVTVADYQEFLNDAAGLPTPSAWCTWNVNYLNDCTSAGDGSADGAAPLSDAATPDPELPVTCVDACDAEAYCKWAGKALCVGKYGSTFQNAGEWYAACSGDGKYLYPYGDTWDDHVCNVLGSSFCSTAPCLVPAANATSCETKDTQLKHMSGNATEWVDECNGTAGGNDACYTRGGKSDDGQANAQCTSRVEHARKYRNGLTGFRCCATWTPP
jgi:Sulfatase-modifying factor enzyme 1